jgi:hypothetical protein
MTTFTNFNKPLSQKGYVIGARLAKREAYQIVNADVPASNVYQNVERSPVKPSFRPFNSSAERFQSDFSSSTKELLPGPGSYEAHNVQQNRSVKQLHTFGGRTKSVPHVSIKCKADEQIKCENCNEYPQGDFYQLKKKILCNRCYEYNFKWQEKFSRA